MGGEGRGGRQASRFDSVLECVKHICSGQEKGTCTGNSAACHVLAVFMGESYCLTSQKSVLSKEPMGYCRVSLIRPRDYYFPFVLRRIPGFKSRLRT